MPEEPSEDITLLLNAIRNGDTGKQGELYEVVYAQLRRIAASLMAAESTNNTLQPTALVHEAFLRLSLGEGAEWNDRTHFLNTAALVMRRTLIDRARAKRALKRGGERRDQPLDQVQVPVLDHFDLEQIEEVESAMNRLREHNERWARVVELRLYLGLSITETGKALGVSPATVKNDYRFALAWLKVQLRAGDSEQCP